MPNNAKQTPIYESYTMLHPDGTVMCHTNEKRAKWYVKRELAKWIDDKQFQLNFVPNGHGKADNPYYNQSMDNRCVVCGDHDNLNRHHVFPYVFRSRLPIHYKESNHHDILPICTDCHENYETIATQYKMELAKQHNIAMNGSMTEAQRVNRKIQSARNIIKKWEDGIFTDIPEDRLAILKEKANQDFIDDENNMGAVWADKIMQDVLENNELFEFIRSWRQHFVDHAKPQYLPNLWSVDHPLEIIDSYTREQESQLENN